MNLANVSLLTICHSTRGIEEFVALLRGHGVATLLDVRRDPGSRGWPWFDSEPLAQSLAEGGAGDIWPEALGGRRRAQPDAANGGWRNSPFRGYADHMTTAEFVAGAERLSALAAVEAVCVMCSEALPWRCNRWLFSDWLVARGAALTHILGPGPGHPHRLTDFARVEGNRELNSLLP